MAREARVGEYWRETTNKLVHTVVHVPGSKGRIAKAACGRFVGPAYGDKRPGSGRRKYCERCKAAQDGGTAETRGRA